MTRTDFHPDLRFARYLPSSLVGPRRLRLMRWLTGLQKPDPRTNSIITVAGPEVPVRVFRPATGDRRPALLWLHGGGLVLNLTTEDDPLCRTIADRLKIVVVSVDYRLAPEHPYPAPLEDCYTGLRWLAELPYVNANRIAIGGGSAGGGLATALALLTRERGELTPPVLQLLVYPMLDDRSSTRTDINRRRLRIWSQASNRFGWQCYLGASAVDATIPSLAVPARHEDLTDLPPAWIGVGTNDLFHDEDVTYAHRLREAGVACTLELVPGAYHAFDRFEAETPVAREFFEAQIAILDRALNG